MSRRKKAKDLLFRSADLFGEIVSRATNGFALLTEDRFELTDDLLQVGSRFDRDGERGSDQCAEAGHPGAAAVQRYGQMQGVTGPQAEAWDLAFIAQYPDAEAFIAMVRDPDYREHVKHRTAGVADSRLLCLTPREPGEGFGE